MYSYLLCKILDLGCKLNNLIHISWLLAWSTTNQNWQKNSKQSRYWLMGWQKKKYLSLVTNKWCCRVIPAYLPCLKLTPIDGPTTYQQTAKEKIQGTLIAWYALIQENKPTSNNWHLKDHDRKPNQQRW